MKSKDKSQLNIKIDPQLLIRLKSDAIKNGKTLTTFVTELLEQGSIKPNANIDTLEERLLRVEQKHNLIDGFSFNKEKDSSQSESIFSDRGAKKYGEIARELFELHRKEKKLSLKDAFEEQSPCLANYDSKPKLVFEILPGNH